MAPKVAIIYYSSYGHIATLAHSVKAGVEEAGGKADLFQIPETLPEEACAKMGFPPKDKNVPIVSAADVADYDAFLFGIPTRFGMMPGQWKAWWDHTGGLWTQGALQGKYAGIFVSTGTPGGGQETTALNTISQLVHHGIIFVPLGYAHAFPEITNLEEVHGSSPWGAGMFAGPTGQRAASKLELTIAKIQGREFYKTVAKAF